MLLGCELICYLVVYVLVNSVCSVLKTYFYLFQAKVIMKSSNVASKLQEMLNDCETENTGLSEKCLADIQAVIQVVSE